MGWMLSIWIFALPALSTWKIAAYEEQSLSASGYHLCVYNETRTVTSLVLRRLPYSKNKRCGGWLFWTACPVTLFRTVHQTEYRMLMVQVTRCCHGYIQVGSYCALSYNRSEEFMTKPGSCPITDRFNSSGDDCNWDIDCPDWQKCCESSGHFLCNNLTRSANYSENGGYRFNATVTVKTDYQQLLNNYALLNHTRLLQAMVTGALESVNFSVYYLASWPVHPYRTATSLLIDSSFVLSLHNLTSKLNSLLKHIQEVSALTVEDVNECAHPALHQCSPLAQCSNIMGSYQCACHEGYLDVDPSNPGTHCAEPNDITMPASTEAPQCCPFPINASSPQTAGNITAIHSNVTVNNVTLYTSAVFETTTYVSTISTDGRLLTTASSPGISRLQVANITGTSFCVYWSSLIPAKQTYLVVLSGGSEVIGMWTTEQTMMELRQLQPGVLYNVTVKLHTNESHGDILAISVKTDAQTLNATTRFTNIPFTDDLHNTSSQAYKNLTAGILDEIYRSLDQDVKAMVNSGQVRIEIRNLSPGSVVVDFVVIFSPGQEDNIRNTSTALLYSLSNSSIYIMDENSTSISDFDECVPRENDCSLWATCTNTWGSYTCSCRDGFVDTEPERPGRTCQATMETTISPSTPIALSSLSTFPSPLSQTTTSMYPDPYTIGTTVETITSAEMASTSLQTSTFVTSTTATTVAITTSVAPTSTSAPTATTTSAPTITSITPATATMAPTSTSVAPSTANTVAITTSVAPTSVAITTTTGGPPSTSIAPTTANTVAITTSVAPTSVSTTTPTGAPTSASITPTTAIVAPTSTSVAPTTAITEAITTSVAPTTTSIPTAFTTGTPTSISMGPTTATMAPTSTYVASSSVPIATTTGAPTSTSITPTTATLAPTSTSAAPTIANIVAMTTSVAPSSTTVPTATTTSALPSTSSAPTTISVVPITTYTIPTTATESKFIAPSTSTSAELTTIAAITSTGIPTTISTTTVEPASSTIATTTNAIQRMTTLTIARTEHTTGIIVPNSNETYPRISSILGDISVDCAVTGITVTVAREFLVNNNIREGTLYLGDQECGVSGFNASHTQLIVEWNKCVTIFAQNESYYVASATLFNTMETYTSPNGTLEAPKLRLEVPIICTYMRSMLTSADFGSMGYDFIQDAITSSGVFHVTVQLLNGTFPLPSNYSLSPEDAVVVEVSLNSSAEEIKVVIYSCWATPTQNPLDNIRFVFLDNRCALNIYTDVLMNGNSSRSRVSVQIFSFVDVNLIYLHCHVQICLQIGSDTCVPDCVQRTTSSSNTIGRAFGSIGPLLQSEEDEPPDSANERLQLIGLSCLGVAMVLFFLIGSACLFYYQRNRIGHYNFTDKSKPLNITDIQFNA